MVKYMRLADYVIKFFENKGVRHAFEVTGGGAMYLNDAVAKSNITPIFCHHEQACTMAAVAYNKLNNDVPLVVCTSGCGSTNTITGVLDAWQDSNSVIIISGQCNLKDIPKGIRKKGFQSVNIIDIVKTITKYAITVDDADKIKYILEKAWYECTNGRIGPVWIDIPLDIQNVNIDVDKLIRFNNNKSDKNINLTKLKSDFEKYLSQSKKPIVLAGNGIRLSNSVDSFKKFISYYNIPCVSTTLASDILPENYDVNIGRAGIKGTRAGNFALANSDLIIVIGSSLHVATTGFQTHLFGREAKKIVIDVDSKYINQCDVEIDKHFKIDIAKFLNIYDNIKTEFDYSTYKYWLVKCNYWKHKWNIFDRPNINELNMYSFVKSLSKYSDYKKTVTITDAGTAYYLLGQAMYNTRLIFPSAQGEMGFAIPASVGIWFADKTKNIVCVTGDGSLQFNIQELQTIKHNKIPLKLFVLNNNGYLSIRITQTKFFESNFSGIDNKTGISFPKLKDIAKTYGFKYYLIKNIKQMDKIISKVLNKDSAVICEVMCPEYDQITPSSAVKTLPNGKLITQPLENMTPFLSEEEYKNEMLIPIYKN